MATITNEEFKRFYKEFKKLNEFGTDSEFADFLNKKGFRPIDKGGPKKWTDKTVFSRRKLLNLKSNVKANTKNPTIIKTIRPDGFKPSFAGGGLARILEM